MISSDQAGAVVALIVSLALHAGFFAFVPGDEAALIEAGSGESGTIRLGNSFADMVAGSAGAATPVVPSSQPVATLAQPDAASAVAVNTTAQPVSAAQPKAVPVTAAVAVSPVETAPSEAAQTVKATEPEPKPEAVAQAQPGGESETRAGADTGVAEGTTTKTASAKPGASDGNAKASNYPGVVMKKLLRTRKDRVSGSGTALVGFSISTSGGIASAQIIKSSGSAAIDKAALALVKRAAPFAAPPDGAQREFSFEFSG